MSLTLERALSGRATQNSIGAIRLIAALSVVVGHAYAYGGFGEDAIHAFTHNQLALGRLAVDIFFSLSGYLISASFERATSTTEYLWHRFVRIYPAYWVCVALTALLVPLLWGVGPDLSYLVHNIPLIIGVDQSIDGVFAKNPIPNVINSSLWTLPWELRAYCVVLVLGLIGQPLRKLGAVGLLLLFWTGFCVQLAHCTGEADLTAVTGPFRLLMFFMAGASFYHYRHKIVLNDWAAAVCAVILLAAILVGNEVRLGGGGIFYAVAPLPLTYLVFCLGKSPKLGWLNSKNDFSYGIYIYGALIEQIYAGLRPQASFVEYLLVTVGATWFAGFMSWHLVERPALSYKDLFKRAKGPSGAEAPGLNTLPEQAAAHLKEDAQ